MGSLSNLLVFGLLLTGAQRCLGQARFANCREIQECIRYSEHGCNNVGKRQICVRWEDLATCPQLNSLGTGGAATSVEFCEQNRIGITPSSTGVGNTFCATVQGGLSYSFGIVSMQRTINSFDGPIPILGYTNGLAMCSGYNNHCTLAGGRDFILTFMVTACPATTTTAATPTTMTTTTQQGCTCPQWSNWSGCSATCGSTARRTRTRGACTSACSPTPLQSETGLCPGVSTNCPINGGYTQWSQWTTCPVTCGTGSQIRSRSCTMPPPQFGGADCAGGATESRSCILGSCPTTNNKRVCRRQARRGVCRRFRRRQRRRCIARECN
ncbi:adhesion G protein-coupled receptor B2-like [Watersipora subatra]|uniref:adhesion G protein-coupled receptor B2-like n=1 Tax=Watersipora subatra TaxID=2589382 RepID=UPI00355B2FEB